MTITEPTTAEASKPIILAGFVRGDHEDVYTQFWGERNLAGITVAECLVSMSRVGVGIRMLLHEDMPREWLPAALEAYDLLSRGELPIPTHDVDWIFSHPVFTERTPEHAP